MGRATASISYASIQDELMYYHVESINIKIEPLLHWLTSFLATALTTEPAARLRHHKHSASCLFPLREA